MKPKSRMKNKPSKLSLKLAERIKRELGIEVEPIIYRTYSGYIERSCAAWSWWMPRTHKSGIGDVGSQDTATKVATAKKWETIKQDYLCEIIVED